MPGNNVATHISKLESSASRLRELNQLVSGMISVTTILNTLAVEFRQFHRAWDPTPLAYRTMDSDWIISRLMVEEAYLKTNELNVSTESARIVN